MPTDQEEAQLATKSGLADQTLTPTPVEAWKKRTGPSPKEEGFIVELPSGNVIRMTRTLDMPLMLRQGRIPNPLAGIVQKMIDQKNPQMPKEAQEDPEVLMQFLDLMNETIVRAVIEPPFDCAERRGFKDGRKVPETAEEYQERLSNWQPKEGHISSWDVEMEDRIYIFAVAQGAAADLASFREESERTLANLQAGEGVRNPSKRASRAGSKK